MALFHSTRSRTAHLTAKEAIRRGIAPDGGLFVTDELGAEPIDLTGLAAKDYPELAREVLGALLPDYTPAEIAACVEEAYGHTFASAEVTPLVRLGETDPQQAGAVGTAGDATAKAEPDATEEAPGAAAEANDAAPAAPQASATAGSRAAASNNTANIPTYVLELWHGPTSAFKDVALQMLPRLMARTAAATGGGTPQDVAAGSDATDTQDAAGSVAAASADDTAADDTAAGTTAAGAANATAAAFPTPPAEKIMIVTATSGDTGKATLEGFADAPGCGITVFYPEGKVSRVQELQMSTQQGANVAVCGVRGNFDDAQSAVKRIFADRELADRLAKQGVALSSANSINVGRLVPQVVYYFSAYAQLLRDGAIQPGDEVEFCVPTGNFGDILAGYYASRLGLPVAKLLVASDRNNVLIDFLATGTYDRNRPFFTTTSPSMDILISSNLERMLYYLSEGDCELVARLMHDLATSGVYALPDGLLERISGVFGGGWASEEQVAQAIAACWNEHGYLIDPHTACGYHVLETTAAAPAAKARVLLSTANPYKFPRAVGDALGLACPEDDFACMQVLENATGTTAPEQLSSLQNKPVLHTDVVDVDEMGAYVAQAAAKL